MREDREKSNAVRYTDSLPWSISSSRHEHTSACAGPGD